MPLERFLIRSSSTAYKESVKASSIKYPLARALFDTVKKDSRNRIIKADARPEVVSDDLCDDALNLLKPSLEQYKGCDIIDLFPGVGLWSRKVHEYLKPRSHIFVEPQKSRYYEFLVPLVEQQGSKYKWIDDMLLEQNITGPENQNILDFAEIGIRSLSDQGTTPHSLLLVLANFAVNVKPSKTNTISRAISPAEPRVFDYARRLHTRTSPHIYGPVRMLMWTLDRDKFNHLPRQIAGRKQTNILLDDQVFVQEIAGGTEATSVRRPAALDISSAFKVAQRMEEAGIQHPKHRQDPVHKAVLTSLRARPKSSEGPAEYTNIPTKSKHDLLSDLHELDHLDRKFCEGQFSRDQVPQAGRDKRIKHYTKEYLRREELRDQFDTLIGAEERPGQRGDDIDRCVFAMAKLNQFEREVMSNHIGDASDEPVKLTESEVQAMEGLEERVKREELACGTFNKSAKTAMTIDNLESFNMQPPLLAWDQRQFEPLAVNEDEFFPARKLVLLDFQPRPQAKDGVPSVQLSVFVRMLRLNQTATVREALETLAHGCSADIMAKCPSLHNPLVGGRLHVDNLRVRMLTHDMWRELDAAWNTWPFKMSEERLMTQVGRSTGFIDFDNESWV